MISAAASNQRTTGGRPRAHEDRWPGNSGSQLTAEQQLAYEQTIEAFNLVSLGMNKGKQQFNSLAMVSENFNQGIEEASRLNEFSKSTNKIFKNK